MATNEVLTPDEFDVSTWDVVDCYFSNNKGQQLVKHQIETYNDFVLRKIDQIIEGFNPILIQHQFLPEHDKFKYIMNILIKNPVLNKPIINEKDGSTKTMTPNDARQRNFTYNSNLNVDLHITTHSITDEGEISIDTKELKNVLLGKIPIMVKSNYCILNNKSTLISGHECKYDYGGYFLINGNEKVIISQDRISENKTYVFVNNKISTYSHIAEIRSVQENKLGVPKITSLKLSAKGNQFGRYIRANIHHIKNDVPVFILFKALGLISDKEILQYILYDINDPLNDILATELIGSIEESNNIQCPRDAFEYLSRYLNITGYPKEILNNKNHRINIIRNVLCTEFLPHVGREFHKKALYLGYMVNKLLKCFLGLREFDDRDSYINKKIDTPGVLMANLFRQYYGKVVKDVKNMLQKEINIGGWKSSNKFSNIINKVNIYKIIKSPIIDSGMRYALATGNWGIKNNKNKQGVAQVLNRMTYSATISHMRRINTPIEKSGKLVQPRKLHPTQWGIICPSETPEGASVGLVKNMSMICSITVSSNSINVRELIREYNVDIFDGKDVTMFYKNTKVIVNGDIVGIHRDPYVFYKQLKEDKLKGIINLYTSIVWNIKDNEIIICTEGGRCVRPVYVVKNGNEIMLTPKLAELIRTKTKTWRDILIQENMIEYIDVEEGNTSMIAMRYLDILKGTKGSLLPVKYTHLEIHPSLILGVLASTIPFSDHNQAPRNCFPVEDHEVLTQYGFLGLNEILEYTADGKKLAVACHVDGHLEFHKIGRDRVVYKDDNDNLLTATEFVSFKSKTKDISIITTTNHNMYGRLGFADKLGPNSYCWPQIEDSYKTYEANEIIQLLDKKPNITQLVPVFQLQCNFKNGVSSSKTPLFIQELGLVTNNHIEAFLWFYGYWLGYSLNLIENKVDNEYITKVFNNLPLHQLEKMKYAEHDYCKTKDYDSNEQLNEWLDYFAEEYGNKDKLTFCSWVYDSLNNSQLKIMLSGIQYESVNNQSVNNESVNMIQTLSLRFRDEVERVCIMAGYSVITRQGTNDAWNVVYTNSSVSATPFLEIKEEIKEVKLKDAVPIFCVSVPTESHLIMVRRRSQVNHLASRATIVGNTYQCILPDTPVLMADRTYKEIQYIKVGEEVVTFHPKTKEISTTKVIYQHVSPTNKQILKIVTNSGKSITATYDHKFMTNTGWMEVHKFKGDTKLATYKDCVTYDEIVYESIKQIITKPNSLISDITTESENHSFIAGTGNFMIHNSAQAKQAIGIYALNFRERYDTLGHVLHYPQRPIIKTKMASILNTDKMPNGINAIVAIQCYTGLNDLALLQLKLQQVLVT